MFTGIVTDMGEILALEQQGDLRARIGTGYNIAGIDIGASIACDGVCLTVVDLGTDPRGWFDVQVSAESLSKTNLDTWAPGRTVNLERALKVGDELGGHFVTGHVDATAKILSYERVKDSMILEIEIPTGLERFIACKGSVTLDGTSLTVNNVYDNSFDVNIISHTQKQTTLGALQIGDLVNLEIDPIARYIERYNNAYSSNLKLLEG